MNRRWIKMAWIMVILMYITSFPVIAYATSEVQVDEQTRQLLEEKYNLDRPEEPRMQDNLFSGDWGMSFRYNTELDAFDRLMQIVPFSWLPLAWVLRLFV
ncbi:hypothetical protein [Paenibacillus pabuli]|uniref:hypothetical protein n=1 Tax=Paenibacillus pabuli TaxID=1472 RepID=UPI000AF51CBD|nr:hypothetical protein [Paenibacillus pabuli]MEC0124036.1 hypothetical protein [Paenibacillus pabuli]